MADPATLATASIGASAGGGILGAVGNLLTGKAQSQMYQYQAGVATLRAQIDKQNADYAVESGDTQAAISGLKTEAEVGQTRARQGASGLSVNSGSATDVVASERAVGGINSAIIRNNAARVAYGHLTEATEDTAQAGLYEMASKTSTTAGEIGAASSLLSGASSVSSKWLQAQQQGIFSS